MSIYDEYVEDERCPECGGTLEQIGGNAVRCEYCGWEDTDILDELLPHIFLEDVVCPKCGCPVTSDGQQGWFCCNLYEIHRGNIVIKDNIIDNSEKSSVKNTSDFDVAELRSIIDDETFLENIECPHCGSEVESEGGYCWHCSNPECQCKGNIVLEAIYDEEFIDDIEVY